MKNWILLAALLSLPAFAAGKDKVKDKDMHNEPTKAQREEMAKFHENMAACLRSDKPMDDCRKEMMKGCQEMGKDACPMGHMGMYGHHHGHHHEMDEEHEQDEKK